MESRSIFVPVVYNHIITGYRTGTKIWLFGTQAFQPSYWLILKREGFSGIAFAPIEEIDIFVLSLSHQQLTEIYQLHHRTHLTNLNIIELGLEIRQLLQTGLVQVYYIEDIDGSHENRLANPHDSYYAMPTNENGGGEAAIRRNQLAERFGQEISARWLGKTKADSLHFSRNWLVRQMVEDYDVSAEIVDTGWDFIKGLWDIGCFVCPRQNNTPTACPWRARKAIG